MEVSCSAGKPRVRGGAGKATCCELAFDRLFAVFELGLDGPSSELARRVRFEEAGGGALYQAGFRGPGASVPS